MAVERCLLFHGREDILHEIAGYLQSDKQQPLVLYGQSGCGKTSIMAQTAKMVILSDIFRHLDLGNHITLICYDFYSCKDDYFR